MTPGDYRRGLVLVTASAVAWSTAGLFTRMIPLDAWTMLAWRGLFGALAVVLAMRLFDPGRGFGVGALGRAGRLYVAVSTVGMVLFVTALRHTTVAHVAVIYATVPLVAAGLGWLVLGERPARHAVLASLAALAGVAIMVGHGGHGGVLGDLLAFAMTVGMAAMMIVARRNPGIPALPATWISALICAVLAWPLGAPLDVSARDLVLLALFGATNSALGLLLFTWGARLIPAVETALLGALDAPLAPLWVWLFFGETPAAATVLGGGIVLVAVTASIRAGARRQR